MSAGDRLRATAATLGVAAAGGGAVLGWGVGVGLRSFRLRRVTVPVLAPGTPAVRVLHLSDLHLLPRQDRKRAFVHALDRLDPHLVVNTGDNIADRDAVPALLDTLGPLLRRPGCFVFGSNDFTAPQPRNPAGYLFPSLAGDHGEQVEDLPFGQVREAFTAAGWLDLDNHAGTLNLTDADLGPGGLAVAVAGTGDAHIDRDELASIPDAPTGQPALAITHAPYRRVLDRFVEHGWPLILAGHTHGGQLRIPGYGAIVSNCDLPPAQAAGLSRWPAGTARGGYLHVSAGLGTSPWAPVRIACPPEASLLTLVPAVPTMVPAVPTMAGETWPTTTKAERR